MNSHTSRVKEVSVWTEAMFSRTERSVSDIAVHCWLSTVGLVQRSRWARASTSPLLLLPGRIYTKTRIHLTFLPCCPWEVNYSHHVPPNSFVVTPLPFVFQRMSEEFTRCSTRNYRNWNCHFHHKYLNTNSNRWKFNVVLYLFYFIYSALKKTECFFA